MFASRLKALRSLGPALRGATGARTPARACHAPEFARPRAFSTTAVVERHILVGVDGGDASMQAVDTAVQMAAEEDEVTLFSVPPVLDADPNRAGAQLADAVAQAYSSARERVKSTAYEAIEGAKCNVRWMEGDAVRGPRKELLRCIDEENVDVVVLGARNISLLEKLFVGSVSNYVAARANCTVLVVR